MINARSQKHSIVRRVFKGNLAYSEGAFRTPFIDPTFEDNLLILKEKGLLFYEQPFRKSDNFPFSTPEREYFEHLERFLMILEPVILDLKGKGFIK